MEVYQIVVDRLEAMANDDDLQIESIHNTEFMDSEQDKIGNKYAIEQLSKRASVIRNIASTIESKGLNNIAEFRQLMIHKFFVRGKTPLSGTFYKEVDRLIVVLETLRSLGIDSFEGKRCD